MIPFGEFKPDDAALGNPGATVAKNVLPHARGYKPMPGPEVFTDALTARCQGAFTGRDTAGVVHSYAGDVSKLYRLVSGVTWTDSSVGGGYAIAADEQWEFVRFGNQVFATNIANEVQEVAMGGSAFANLITSTVKPNAKHIAVIGGHVVLGNVNDGTLRPFRVRWSALGDGKDFDQSGATLADFQDLDSSTRGSNAIERIIGREYGVIFQAHSVWRMTPAPSPFIFQFDEVETNRGLFASGAAAASGNMIFYLSDDGVYMLVNGSESFPIGEGKINRFLFDDLNAENRQRISATLHPNFPVFMLAYPSGNSQAGDPDRILVYNWVAQRFAFLEVDLQYLYAANTPGIDLEGLDNISTDLDALPASLDSRTYIGGASSLAMFDRDNKTNHFTGTAMNAVIETGEVQITPGRKTFISGCAPVVDGPSATVSLQLGTRNTQQKATVFKDPVTVNDNGLCPLRSEKRFMRFRTNITGDFIDAVGIDTIDAVAGGQV